MTIVGALTGTTTGAVVVVVVSATVSWFVARPMKNAIRNTATTPISTHSHQRRLKVLSEAPDGGFGRGPGGPDPDVGLPGPGPDPGPAPVV
jgi:hypothetical protein